MRSPAPCVRLSSGVARLLTHHNVLKLQLLKPAKDVGLVALDEWTDRDRGRSRFEGTALHLQVSLDIRLECFEVGVPQDVLDGHRGNTGLEHVHGFRVSEAVRTDPLSVQGRTVATGEPPVVVEYKTAPDRVSGAPRA